MFTNPANEIEFSDVETFCKEYGEGVRVEYKSEIRHVPKIVSSFANTQGGILLFGADTDENNKVIFPIPGIPNNGGIQDQIQQSALTGIYPPVIPEVIICDVPGTTGNVVVIVRVNESQQAPHALQNSNKVYIRVGSITQPYELADIDRIEYLLKRRERPQGLIQQILSRMDDRAQFYLEEQYKTNPYLTLICRPVFPYRPIISPSGILTYLRKYDGIYANNRDKYHFVWPFKEGELDFGTRKVTGGAGFMGRSINYELNEYGILYYGGKLLEKQALQGGQSEPNTLRDYDIIHEIYEFLHNAWIFYQECDYLGDIEFQARLQQIYGWKLYLGEPHVSEQIPSIESQVSASIPCAPLGSLKVKDYIDLIMELSNQLFWSFDVQNYNWQDDWRNKLEDWFSRSIMSETQNE